MLKNSSIDSMKMKQCAAVIGRNAVCAGCVVRRVHFPRKFLIASTGSKRNGSALRDGTLGRSVEETVQTKAGLTDAVTKAFNQAVKRNAERFPENFAFQLTPAELVRLRSQTVTSNQKRIGDQVDTGNWSQVVTSSRGWTSIPPLAFH